MVDTSVWVAYLQEGNIGLEALLNDGPKGKENVERSDGLE
jgi:hypothetical protein